MDGADVIICFVIALCIVYFRGIMFDLESEITQMWQEIDKIKKQGTIVQQRREILKEEDVEIQAD